MEILQEHRHGGIANGTKEETEEPMDEEKSIPRKRRRRLTYGASITQAYV